MLKEKNDEEEKQIYGCSVIMKNKNVLFFCGTLQYILDKLKFIKSSILFSMTNISEDAEEDSEFEDYIVLATQQNDVSSIRLTNLKNYKDDLVNF